jgi:hypothetical protein
MAGTDATSSSSDTSTSDTSAAATHYRRPGWFTRNVANRLVARLTRWGISVWGSRVLEVPGRRTGVTRSVPVNVLALGGRRYLVSARGEGEWVRNVRAAEGSFALRLGRRREAVHATELADADKVPVLRAYLRRWKAEVGAFFDGVDADSDDAAILAEAHRHPTFVLEAPARP